ncbi:hypothetical protein CDO28_02040 [Sinorhizobium meliloti]|uniref:hypothetical protein n=1 Tax=Rhizobium meliloti TaxID=382 RepID=UPI000B4A4FC5|nr:hypothetical protein [Sinorhizobium meliloti]ASP70451.1 hypothetical protein CDO28_02040 [Sinorhizobium meliloti]MDE3854900.1 hypothetical protein [Sinorhizobium meliloti]MQW52574.1 hypothetical protein [Sinorhizobium meliloti]
MSFVEAGVVLAIIHVPYAFRILYEALGTPGMDFSKARILFFSAYKYGDVMGYAAGMLASTTVWFFFNFRLFANRIPLLLFLVIGPLFLLFLSSPIYFRDLNGNIGNTEFVSNYVIFLLLVAAFFWIFSMYQQRTAGTNFDVRGADSVNQIMKTVHPG